MKWFHQTASDQNTFVGIDDEKNQFVKLPQIRERWKHKEHVPL